MHSHRVFAKLIELHDLPTLPQIVSKLLEAVEDERSSADDVTALLETDHVISARVLRLANSAYYGLRHRVDSIRRAVVVLGFDAVCQLALATSVFKTFSSQRQFALDRGALGRQVLHGMDRDHAGKLRLDLVDHRGGAAGDDGDPAAVAGVVDLGHGQAVDVVAPAREEADHPGEDAGLVLDDHVHVVEHGDDLGWEAIQRTGDDPLKPLLPRVLDRIETHSRFVAAELDSHVRTGPGDIATFHSLAAVGGLMRLAAAWSSSMVV